MSHSYIYTLDCFPIFTDVKNKSYVVTDPEADQGQNLPGIGGFQRQRWYSVVFATP